MNGKHAVSLCACVGITLSGCMIASSDVENDNNNDNSSQSETRDFSGFSSFSYTLSENGGPTAVGIVENLQIKRVEDGGYSLNFSVGDGAHGLVAAPERMLNSDQENRMLAIFGDVTIVTLSLDPDGCAGVGLLAFFEAFDWDGEVFDRVSPCFSPRGISFEDHADILLFLGDLVGEEGTMRSI